MNLSNVSSELPHDQVSEIVRDMELSQNPFNTGKQLEEHNHHLKMLAMAAMQLSFIELQRFFLEHPNKHVLPQSSTIVMELTAKIT
jgi:hypothetical protein